MSANWVIYDTFVPRDMAFACAVVTPPIRRSESLCMSCLLATRAQGVRLASEVTGDGASSVYGNCCKKWEQSADVWS